MNRCLACYRPLSPEEGALHTACSRKFFRQPVPPDLPYAEDELEHLARQVLQSRIALPGAQPKISLQLGKRTLKQPAGRLTIVGLWGDYILKPPTSLYPALPEVEDMTMHLARLARIKTVPHSLISMKSGSLAYITKRVDRTPKGKLAMEDMCQLTGRMTEEKYFGSYEQIAKALKQYSVNPGLDLVNFYEVVLFTFLTGNNDMHLKNFSLIHSDLGYGLSAAYDLVASQLVVEGDDEELALNLNGKKKKLRKSDFIEAMKSAHIPAKTIDSVFVKFQDVSGKWPSLIERSFLPSDTQAAYKELIRQKIGQLFG